MLSVETRELEQPLGDGGGGGGATQLWEESLGVLASLHVPCSRKQPDPHVTVFWSLFPSLGNSLILMLQRLGHCPPAPLPPPERRGSMQLSSAGDVPWRCRLAVVVAESCPTVCDSVVCPRDSPGKKTLEWVAGISGGG